MTNASLSLTQQRMSSSLIGSFNSLTIQQSIISIIDKCLQHLNQICQANIVVQDVYIELLKEKKTMKFEQIKKIYMTLTEGKDKQILFQKDKDMLAKTDYNNHEAGKVVLEVFLETGEEDYVLHGQLESFVAYISQRTHPNSFKPTVFQTFTEDKELLYKLIQQNLILQRKIYDILLNRGYVVSLDQFYKLNGCDAEHRESYEATMEEGNQQQQEMRHQNVQQKAIHKNDGDMMVSSLLNHKMLSRKKKVFRSDYKLGWKQKIVQQQPKSLLSLNKTNFQIKQGFNQLIGDLLSNDNLKEIFSKYNNNQQDSQRKLHNSQSKRNNDQSLHESDLIQKRIFQNKIQSVITQLKTNNITVNAKLLEIINNSSTQAINSKHNLISERKNTFVRQNSLTNQRKLRESYMISNRKLVNQNLYRELLKRNVSLQNVINQEIIVHTTEKIKRQLQQQSKTQQGHVIGFTIIEQHNQNSPPPCKLKKMSRLLSNSQKTKAFIFKSDQKPKTLVSSQSILKRNSKLLQRESAFKDLKVDNLFNDFVEGDKSLTEKIRIAKQDWDVKYQQNILDAIETSQFDPLNPKITEIVDFLNNKQDAKIDPLLRQLFTPVSKQQSQFTRSRHDGLKTQQGQRITTSPKVRYLSSDFDPLRKTQSTNFNSRIKTEMSSIRRNQKAQSGFLQMSNSRYKCYEVFDRRMRRVIRQ